MRFKTDRIQSEYKNALIEKNPKLYMLLGMLDRFCQSEFGNDVCITDLFRTEADLKLIYKDVANPPSDSPHCHWNAADIRSTDWTKDQKSRMLKFLNCFTYKSGQGRPVAFIHAINGNVEHFHIQCN